MTITLPVSTNVFYFLLRSPSAWWPRLADQVYHRVTLSYLAGLLLDCFEWVLLLIGRAAQIELELIIFAIVVVVAV